MLRPQARRPPIVEFERVLSVDIGDGLVADDLDEVGDGALFGLAPKPLLAGRFVEKLAERDLPAIDVEGLRNRHRRPLDTAKQRLDFSLRVRGRRSRRMRRQRRKPAHQIFQQRLMSQRFDRRIGEAPGDRSGARRAIASLQRLGEAPPIGYSAALLSISTSELQNSSSAASRASRRWRAISRWPVSSDDRIMRRASRSSNRPGTRRT